MRHEGCSLHPIGASYPGRLTTRVPERLLTAQLLLEVEHEDPAPIEVLRYAAPEGR